MKIINADQFRKLDSQTTQSILTNCELMHRAGKAISITVQRLLRPKPTQNIYILVGPGNNGGDGLVVCEELQRSGYFTTLVFAEKNPKLSEAAKYFYNLIPKNVVITTFEELEFGNNDIIIDSLFGIGLNRKLDPEFSNIIERANQSEATTIAVDIPSGLNSDSGEVLPIAINADYTITVGLPKTGLFIGSGPKCTGTIEVIDIGYSLPIINELHHEAQYITPANLRLPKRKANAHKKSFGTVAIVSGCDIYQGAPILTASATIRSGCGYVNLITTKDVDISRLPLSIIINKFSVEEGVFNSNNFSKISEFSSENTTTVFGPGVGRKESLTTLLKQIIEQSQSLVLDADGLFLLTKLKNFSGFKRPTVLTPHPGEMRTLMERFIPESVNANRCDQANLLAEKLHCYVILKGKNSVITSPDYECWINSTGNNSLATAGSGDVLAGMVASFMAEYLCKGLPVIEALKFTTYLHGKCADINGQKRSFIAEDIINTLTELI